jgi:hypothetical protein
MSGLPALRPQRLRGGACPVQGTTGLGVRKTVGALRLTPFGVNPSQRNELGLASGRSYDLSGGMGTGTRNPLLVRS